MNREKLLAARAKALADAQAIVDGAAEGMTAEQLTAVRGFKAAADNLAEQIEAMDGLEAARRKTLTAAPATEGTPVKVPAKAIDHEADERIRRSGYEEALKALSTEGRNRDAIAALEAKGGGDSAVDFAKKTLTVGTTNAAGFMVYEQDVGLFVEKYKPQTIVRRLAPTPLQVADGSYWTHETGSPVASWTTENPDTPPSATGFTGERVSFAAKTLEVHADATKQLIASTGGRATSRLVDLIGKAVALEEDKQLLIGTGTSNKPAGIVTAITGGQTAAAATVYGTPTFAQAETVLQALIQNLRNADNPLLNPVYLTTANLYSILERLLTDQGNRGYPELMANGRIGMYPAFYHTNMTAEMLAMVDFDQVVIADFGGMEINVSDVASYTNASGTLVSPLMQGTVVYQMKKRMDVQVRDAKFAVRRTGIKWGQTAP